MPQKTIRTNDLTVGQTALVRGHVTYSHIRTKVEGAALARANEKAKLRGGIQKDRPYTTISICDAQVVQANPAQASMEEMYLAERLFPASSQEYTGMSYTAESKSNNLPAVGVLRQDGSNIVDWLPEMEGELARGLDVTIVMSVFAGNPNKGFGMQAVICNEPIKYWGRQNLSPQLAKYGFKMSSEPPVRQQTAPAEEVPPMPDDPYMGGAMPPPNPGVPVSAPSGNPYASQPTQPYPAAAPAGYPPPAAPAGYPPAAPGYPAGAPAGYPPPAAAPAAPAGYPPVAAPAPDAYVQQPPQPQGYPGPFQPQPAPGAPVAGYPGSNDGVNYNPNSDPERQY